VICRRAAGSASPYRDCGLVLTLGERRPWRGCGSAMQQACLVSEAVNAVHVPEPPRIQRDVPCNQHGPPWPSSPRGTPSADDLGGWATPVATDPRRTRDERPHRRTWSFAAHVFAAAVRVARMQRRSARGVRGRAQGGPATEGGGAARRAASVGSPSAAGAAQRRWHLDGGPPPPAACRGHPPLAEARSPRPPPALAAGVEPPRATNCSRAVAVE
jgi:hypothetical protein